ncbi:MAG TPA: phytanoyl-CoA dioxygenase family protein [Acidimicrobiales bacterium]|nr:phytanoyl-CoA dioxygenase family protein [Acidimicrobiales bacterium]
MTAVDTELTPELVENFRRDGFVVVPDLLSADERRRYGSAVDEAVRTRSRGDTRTLAEKSRYEQSFIQCQNLWEDSAGVRPLTFHPLLAETAARLLGVGAVRLWHDQALYKEPGGRETDPHQDQPYWPIVETDTITAWIPFDGSTLETGAMGYLPGSHRLGLREFVNIFTGEAGGGDDGVLGRDELAGIEPVFVEVPAGAVAFHHGLTFHLAGANRSGAIRRVHTVIYFADGSTRGAGRFPHPSVERAGIGMGEVIASDVTPVAWPRPAGSPLPPAPASPLR